MFREGDAARLPIVEPPSVASVAQDSVWRAAGFRPQPGPGHAQGPKNLAPDLHHRVGTNPTKSRRLLIRAWYQEYPKTFIPSGLLHEKLGILPGWDTVLWQDTVTAEDIQRVEGDGPRTDDELGRAEMKALIEEIDQNADLLTL